MRIIIQLVALLCACAVKSLQLLGSTTLGQDPGTINRLNGESFQQDALVTFNSKHSRIIRVFRSLMQLQTISMLSFGWRVLRIHLFVMPM